MLVFLYFNFFKTSNFVNYLQEIKKNTHLLQKQNNYYETSNKLQVCQQLLLLLYLFIYI